MKNLFFKLICLATFLPALTQGQDAGTKNYLGTEVSYLNPSLFRDGCFPALTFSHGRHFFMAGPLALYEGYDAKPYWGAQAGYRYYPNGSDNRFNLFFDFNSGIVSGKRSYIFYQRYYWGNNVKVKANTNFVSIDNYFGFGFQLKILKNLYMNTGVGLGIGLYKKEYKYIYEGGIVMEGKGSLKFRDIFDASRIFKIGLGYRFRVSAKR